MSRNLYGFVLTAIALLAGLDCGAPSGNPVQPPPTDTVAKSLATNPAKLSLFTGGAYGLPSCKQQSASVGVNALNAASQTVKAPEVTWRSSDPSIVSVSNGTVTSQDVAGAAKVTATTADGMTASTEVTVARNEACRDTATAVRVSAADLSPIIVDGAPRQVTATVFPDSANPSGTWSSSAPDVLAVDDKGMVTALKEGGADICRTTSNNKKGCQGFIGQFPVFTFTPEWSLPDGSIFISLASTGCPRTSVKVFSSVHGTTFTSRDQSVLSVSAINDTSAVVTGVSASGAFIQAQDKYNRLHFMSIGVSRTPCYP